MLVSSQPFQQLIFGSLPEQQDVIVSLHQLAELLVLLQLQLLDLFVAQSELALRSIVHFVEVAAKEILGAVSLVGTTATLNG